MGTPGDAKFAVTRRPLAKNLIQAFCHPGKIFAINQVQKSLADYFRLRGSQYFLMRRAAVDQATLKIKLTQYIQHILGYAEQTVIAGR